MVDHFRKMGMFVQKHLKVEIKWELSDKVETLFWSITNSLFKTSTCLIIYLQILIAFIHTEFLS